MIINQLRPRTRRAKIATGLLGFLLAFGLGIAIGAFLAKAPIQGGVESTPFEPQWDTSVTYLGDRTSEDMVCTTGMGAVAGSLKLDVTKAYPNGFCTFAYDVWIADGAAEDGRVVGTDLALPDGWEVTIVAGCGAVVPREQFGGVKVKLRVTMTASASTGSASTFAVGDGLLVRPESSNAPLQC